MEAILVMLLQLEPRRVVWHSCIVAAGLLAHVCVLHLHIVVWRVCFDPVRAVRAVCAGIPVFVLKGYYQVRVAVCGCRAWVSASLQQALNGCRLGLLWACCAASVQPVLHVL